MNTCPPCNQQCNQGRTCPARGQTRLGSLTETVISIAIGFVVSVLITDAVMPMYGHEVSPADNLEITAIFTVASIVRGYYVRRMFNALGRAGQ